MEDSVREVLLDREVVHGIQVAFDTEGPGAFPSLVVEFLANSEASIRSIEAAISEQDWAAARRLAHRLKGMSSQLGALALREASKDLEEALDENENPSTCLLDRIFVMREILRRTTQAYHTLIGDLERS